MKRVLGLDLGTNSIGWAVLDVPDTDGEIGQVVALGSRIFAEGAERDGSALLTKAKQRRLKRGMRRQVLRKSQRQRHLRTELVRAGLLPESDGEFADLMTLDPAVLVGRSDNGESLSLREIGRVVYWFGARRGFLSLRSGGGDFVDAGEHDEAPKRYRRQMVDPASGEIVDRGQEGRLVEFLSQQQTHHPQILSYTAIFGQRGKLTYPVKPIARAAFRNVDGSLFDEFGLHGLVFFQRKVTWSQGSIGACSLDPRSGARAAVADRLAQRFRVWKTVIDLRVDNPERPLTAEERLALFELLMSQKSATFSSVRKKLSLGADVPINFERPEKKDLTGNGTDTELRRLLGVTWDTMTEESKDELVHLLLGNASDDQVRAVLSGHFGLDADQTNAVTKAKFPAGRAAYSRATLRRLLAVIDGCETEREAISNAGYPTPESVRQERGVEISGLTNPLVKTTLMQLRRTLAAVARTYGNTSGDPFDVVRIELTRDVRQNQKQRERTSTEQRDRERSRKRAKQLISEYAPGAENSRDALRSVLLWETQQQQCLYCGKAISPTALFSPGFEMDHILPRSRTLDDGLSNMALVCAAENQNKGNRTITEWKGADYASEVAERAKMLKLPRGLVSRITQAHVSDDAIPESLLVQTGYINAVARDFVRQELGVTPQVSSGRITAQLRYRLGLHKDGEDHRRHGLDAAAIALCDARIALKLANAYRNERDYAIARKDERGGWEPWVGARNAVEAAYEKAVVSHVSKGKTGGAWFEDTRYGTVQNPQRPGVVLSARRRDLASITNPKRLAEVADPVVRQALEADLRHRGIDPDGAKFSFSETNPPRMLDGTPIRKVRCHLSLPGNVAAGARAGAKTTVTPAGNHSAWVYENTVTGKWRTHIISRYEAFCDRSKPLAVRRIEYSQANENFLFSVTIGCTIELDTENGERSCFKVNSLDRANSRISVSGVASSGNAAADAVLRASRLKERNALKAVVLPDGQIRTARD